MGADSRPQSMLKDHPTNRSTWMLLNLLEATMERGQPAISVPLYWNEADIPIGVQFAGRFGDEGTLFRLAAELEKARPWGDKRPAICA